MKGTDLSEAAIDQMFSRVHQDHLIVESQIGWLSSYCSYGDPLFDKLDGSYSGWAVAIAHISVVQSVIMFLNRSIDNNGDSLTRLIKVLSVNDNVIRQRLSRLYLERHGKQVEFASTVSIWEYLQSCLDKVKNDPSMKSFQVFRNAWIGHRLSREVYSKKFNEQNLEKHRASSEDAVRLARDLLHISHQAAFNWNLAKWEIEGRVDKAAENCTMFWELLPKLKKTEVLPPEK
ncbi:hypothetical protein [Ascidiaceihabitans sp.]|uniref:hypothetical protein n=1 Tax=Ascidiaceihabitans sp. TaxID=1872644 RepID=UPI003299D7B6